MERLQFTAIKWLFLLTFYLIFSSRTTHAKVYKSCQDARVNLGSSATDGYYSIELPKGIAVSLYCKGMDTDDPKEYLNLPAGKSKNYALIYSNKGVPDDCYAYHPTRTFTESGKSEFEKVRFDTGTMGIILDDFTFASKIGLNHVKYGTAGDFFASKKSCQPRGNFRVDLTDTPFIISKYIKWFWKGQFSNGSTDGEVIFNKDSYVGCFKDKRARALPSAFMTNKWMTIERCKLHCKYKGFSFAGLQDSQECYCGNSYDKYGPSKACRMRCKGNKSEICGGPWALSVYVIGTPQFLTGRCGGYPGYCYPAQKHDKDSQLLILQFNPKHPCYRSVCGSFAKCLAIDTSGYECICPKGMSGRNCEKRSEIISKTGTCPPKYQPEVCRCDASNCFGAKFQNGKCVTLGGKPQVVCRYGDPSHLKITIKTSTASYYSSVGCPYGTEAVSCSYWDPQRKIKSNGVKGLKIRYRTCSYYSCKKCVVQAICLKIDCGCKNGGKCSMESEQCICRPGYTGPLCEEYDYCSFWEQSHKKVACTGAGICRSVPTLVVSTIAGDNAGDRCIFPFKYQGQTFSRCISDNRIGPPFACATNFNGRSTFIDLGKWSPGPQYSILAWVKPTLQDSVHRLVVGSISDCRDFGIGFQFGRFQTYYASHSKSKCTIPLSTYNFQSSIDKWHSVAVMNTGKLITLMVDGKVWGTKVTYSHFLGNANGFKIGGAGYSSSGSVQPFKGSIKNVKIYNKALSAVEVDKVFAKNGVEDSIDEIKRGLVGHYELGETLSEKCNGIDHGFQDWIPETFSQISGTHCNISRFIIEEHTKVFVARWNGASNGSLEVTANEILIKGELTAAGAGYYGGKPSHANGADGNQGESHSDPGSVDVNHNRGAGGGGLGEKNSQTGGLPGGGAGYGTSGFVGMSKATKQGVGAAGGTYGSSIMHYMYLGSGGGSGGNAMDLTQTPRGGAGGNGGGAIKLYADTRLVISGTISVQGEDGIGDPIGKCLTCPSKCGAKDICSNTSPMFCWDKSGPGGGGSGGSIYLSGESVDIGIDRLFLMGGNGGQGAYMCGGKGGMGRLFVLSSRMEGRLNRAQGMISRSARGDKVKDFSHIGHTVGNKEIQINTNQVYLGCIKENKNFLMKHKVQLSSYDARRLTPSSCHKLCSDAGHVYSGTTKGDQCYCDDDVTTNAYAADGDCDSPCPGDKKQFCGGDGEVLVFGPKPSSFARRASGALVKCESWCVTADAEKPKPKWGQCVDEGSTLSMGLSCECPLGKRGDDCTVDCPQGTWGLNCAQNCSCNGNPCDLTRGTCTCKPGFHGHSCNRKICPPRRMGTNCDVCLIRGKYGKDCKNCDCHDGSCNSVSGSCKCSLGRMGKRCEQVCPPNKWGRGCRSFCTCRNNGTCEPIYGMCNCLSGYTGRKCDKQCPTGYFGDRCRFSCPICSTDNCHHVTGNCICDSGYKGINCTEPCPTESWGIGCAQPCDPNCKNGCNPMDGSCCTKGRCADGQYCATDGSCIGKPIIDAPVISAVKSSSLGVGGIIGLCVVVLLVILCAIVGIVYFCKGKQMFDFTVAKYKSRKDDVVLEGNFANPFYEQMNDASKPTETAAANSPTEIEPID